MTKRRRRYVQYRELNPGQRANILQSSREFGWSQESIASFFHASRWTVRRVLKEARP